MDEILYQDDDLWHVDGRKVHDPRALAWLELAPDDCQGVARALSGAEPDPSEAVTIDRYESDQVELAAKLNSPGLVVLADVYYPGWELTIDGKPTRILRANRAMRGALVGAGSHRLVYRYRPTSVIAGAAISILGVLALLILLWRSRVSAKVTHFS